MSCDLTPDSFHVKKGGVRRTVSKRKAYVNTPSQIIKRLKAIQKSTTKNYDIAMLIRELSGIPTTVTNVLDRTTGR